MFFIILFKYFQISTIISILTHGLYGSMPANFETHGDLLRHTHTHTHTHIFCLFSLGRLAFNLSFPEAALPFLFIFEYFVKTYFSMKLSLIIPIPFSSLSISCLVPYCSMCSCISDTGSYACIHAPSHHCLHPGHCILIHPCLTSAPHM